MTTIKFKATFSKIGSSRRASLTTAVHFSSVPGQDKADDKITVQKRVTGLLFAQPLSTATLVNLVVSILSRFS